MTSPPIQHTPLLPDDPGSATSVGPSGTSGFLALPWLVVIGASAGGLEALRQVVPALPYAEPIAVVVALHLSPNHRSMLAELLARETPAPVHEVVDDEAVRPGRLYVVPAGTQLEMADGRFHLTPLTTVGVPRPNIDRVMEAAARMCGERCIGVVLSGTGSDGSRGVRAVRAAGGFVVIQEPGDARFDSMPAHAVASGAAHHVVPASELAEVVARLVRQEWPRPVLELADEAGMDDAVRCVRAGVGFDIGAYKPSTVRRRVERRMRARACHALAEYVALLQAEPEEQRRLVQELLISVTGFFRDPELAASLAQHLEAPLRQAAEEGRELRVWVAGCATGEEPYTLALMLVQTAARLALPLRLRMFATDIDAAALDVARKGIYAASAWAEVPEAWRSPLLELDGELVRVSAALRDMVLFSEHNLLRDPPFLRIDLLACRNLMIYLQPRAQQGLLQQFQLSLGAGALLWLGRAETLAAGDGFERPAGPEVPGLYRCQGLGAAGRPRAMAVDLRRQATRPTRERVAPPAQVASLLVAAHEQGAFGPALAMGDDGTLLHTFGDLSRHLKFQRGGPASLNLADLVAPRLAVELRALAYRSRAAEGQPRAVVYDPEDGGPPLKLVAAGVPAKGATVVQFQTLDAPATPRLDAVPAPAALDEVQALREHVNANREHLQTLVSELDAANEELQLLNEELQASNEELQSTNEELETSNEELQSTNEELITVNEELELRGAELTQRNADLNNVKNSLLDPLLVLDEHGRVLLSNAAAQGLFRFDATPGDLVADRPMLAALPTQLPLDTVLPAVQALLAGAEASELRLDKPPGLGGRSFTLRLQPYLGPQGERCGAVLQFHDTTLQQRLQADLASSEAFRRATVDALPDEICVLDDAGNISGVNQSWADNLSQFEAAGSARTQAGVGASYLSVCEDSARGGDLLAKDFLHGLNRVRERQTQLYEQEYPCQRPDGLHWFRATVTPFGGSMAGVVVRHQDITELHDQRDKLLLQSRALEASGNGVVIADARLPQLPMVYVNTAFETLTGYTASEMLGRSCALLQGSDRQQPGVTTLRAALARRENVRVLLRNYKKSGELFWNELTISMVAGEEGRVTHMVGVQRDMTALIESESALRAAQRREAQALSFAGLGTLDWRLRDGVLLLSPHQARLFDLPGDVTSVRWIELRQRVHAEDLPLVEDALKLCVAGHAPLDVQLRLRGSDGSHRWLQVQGDVERDDDQVATHLMAICQDITVRRAAEERATFISQHDVLTGLPNRALLRDRLQVAIRTAQRERNHLALVFIDLDRFKEVNDSLGHDAGDELLRQVAERLRSSVRASDTVCRLGGDEFLLLLPSLHDLDEAGQVAQKVQAALQQPMTVGGQQLRPTASLGVCVFPEDGTDADTLMRHADAAMYRAKGGGRNAVRFYADEADVQQHRALSLRGEMAAALEGGQLRLHYQPQLGMADGRLRGFEALLRWQHPTRGLIGPADFAALLEDSSLIEQIGTWVLREACRQAVAWRGGAAGVPVAVNVSPLQLRDGRFVQLVNKVLGESGARPAEIELELTERAILHHATSAATAMHDLRGLGLGIALDDFGTGYSSLSHLHQHPISKLKIDSSFCAALPGDRNAAAIVRAIIQMASTLGLEVVAEGVEQGEQAEFLRDAGCASVQGFLHAPALAADDALAWARQLN